jgi:hypothetical protein
MSEQRLVASLWNLGEEPRGRWSHATLAACDVASDNGFTRVVVDISFAMLKLVAARSGISNDRRMITTPVLMKHSGQPLATAELIKPTQSGGDYVVEYKGYSDAYEVVLPGSEVEHLISARLAHLGRMTHEFDPNIGKFVDPTRAAEISRRNQSLQPEAISL